MAKKIIIMTNPIAECQSLVHSSHKKLRFGAAIWWAWTEENVPHVRETLASIFNQVNFGIPDSKRTQALQIAFSAQGLTLLGVGEDAIQACGRSFSRGVTTARLNRALGDRDEADPLHWHWTDQTAHLLVLVYANSNEHLIDVCDNLDKLRAQANIRQVHRLTISLPEDHREPFGFVDGISNIRPSFDKSTKTRGSDLVAAGEVVLGLKDELGVTESKGWLGDGGSFLVGRQIQQDVKRFWQFWEEKGSDQESAVWLASKAMGRWLNGMPISGSAPHPQPTYDPEGLAFDFVEDQYGYQCPIGSHIRRANPRNGLDPHHPKRSARISATHRLLRRGRKYGGPAPSEWFPEILAETTVASPHADPDADRGLLFICLVGDIARQFEFVQQTWLNNSRFVNLSGGVDPISPGQHLFGDEGIFTIPHNPLRQRIKGLQSFTLVRGGGYFLLPSKSAMQRILSPPKD